MTQWMRRLLLTASLTIVFAATLRADAPELNRKLAEIDRQRDGLHTPSARLEQDCRALLPQHATPEEKGMIHAQIALIYAQDGLRTPDKTIETCRKALEFPLDPVMRSRMYVHWADGLQAKHREATGAAQIQARREIATVCLQGLQALLAENPPAQAVPLPSVDRFEHAANPNDPEYQALVHKNAVQMEARRRAMLMNDLVMYRNILIEKVAWLYPLAEGVTTDELSGLARPLLKDRADDVLARIEQRRPAPPAGTGMRNPADNR